MAEIGIASLIRRTNRSPASILCGSVPRLKSRMTGEKRGSVVLSKRILVGASIMVPSAIYGDQSMRVKLEWMLRLPVDRPVGVWLQSPTAVGHQVGCQLQPCENVLAKYSDG